MNLRADGEGGSRGGLLDEGDKALSGAEGVGLLADLEAALGMDDDLNAGVPGANRIDVAGQKALMDGAVALPEQDAAGGDALLRLAALTLANLNRPWIPNHHFVERNTHGVAGVASQVLVGKEENALTALKSPFEGGVGIRRSTDQPAPLAAEGFDGGGGVHIRQRYDLIGEAKAFERLPAGFHLGDFGHISHRAAGVKVGQNDLLAGAAEYVGALGHEVDAAENNVLGGSFGGDAGELVAIAGGVGEADHLVALVVVAEQQGCRAQFGARPRNALVHGVVGEREVVF